MSRITSTSNSLITQGQQPLKKNPAASLSLAINQHSPSFPPLVLLSPNIFLPFGVCICDRSGHSGVCMCFSLFRRGRMTQKSVWTHTYMCLRHQWHGEEMSATVSLNNFSPLTGGWLKWQAASVTSAKAHKQHLFMLKRQSPLEAVENRILVNLNYMVIIGTVTQGHFNPTQTMIVP